MGALTSGARERGPHSQRAATWVEDGGGGSMGLKIREMFVVDPRKFACTTAA
jgi:hypothetical protein